MCGVFLFSGLSGSGDSLRCSCCERYFAPASFSSRQRVKVTRLCQVLCYWMCVVKIWQALSCRWLLQDCTILRGTTLCKFSGTKNLGASCWLGSYLQAVAPVFDWSRAPAEARLASDKQCVSALLRPVMHLLSRGQSVPDRKLRQLLGSLTLGLADQNRRGQDPHELHACLASDPGLLNAPSSERSFPHSMQLQVQTSLVCQICAEEHSRQTPENAVQLSTTDREGRPAAAFRG